MTTQIRKSVFETNSSSTHSLSISDIGGLYQTLRHSDGIISVPLGFYEFGWEQETYYDAESKLAYMMIYARDWSKGKEKEFFEILKEIVEKQTGCILINDESEGGYDNGYIDHQSVEDCDLHYMFYEPELIRQFIFNPNSYLETDNDNH